ncbi:AraC family transcriptional regulator [Ruegeria jejuensis]|uniref:AraC family transcriptional regulator n=1 Tax=Ruegeria jejuensis TaxID=3233338 RepID=UPI00355BA564
MGQFSTSPLRATSADALQHLPQSVVSMRRQYQAGDVSRWHSHPRTQLIYAVSGLMMAETQEARWTVPERHCLLVPADLPHEVRMVGAVDLQSLYIAPDSFAEGSARFCQVLAVSDLLAALIARFCDLDNPWPVSEHAHHLSRLILLELAEAQAAPLALPFPDHPGLRRACEALFSSPSQALTIDGWANEAGLSRRSFTRLFKHQTGLSFGEWRQRLRCQAALQAVARGTPLARVAASVGYDSPYSLTAMMQRLL